jgi:sec-independent protein translocase protein TatA
VPQIGPLEIVIVGVIALIVFGPERLPEMGRSLGKGFHQMKRMASDVKAEFNLGLEADQADASSKEPAPADPVTVNDPVPGDGPADRGTAVEPKSSAARV